MPLHLIPNHAFIQIVKFVEAVLLPSCVYLVYLLPSIVASPIPESLLQHRQTVNCTDLKADFDASCWMTLGLSDYLEYPETGWMYTTPKCSEGQSGANCCMPDVPWTTCYLHLAHGVSGADCSEINPQACSWDPTLDVDPSIAPQVRYVMRNIYSKHVHIQDSHRADSSQTSTTFLRHGGRRFRLQQIKHSASWIPS